jgi:hypothetical protein
MTVSVNAAFPGGTELGLRLEITGAIQTVNVVERLTPPPGAGLRTVIGKKPLADTSAAVIAAVSCVPETNAVVRPEPANWTIEEAVKPEPVSVRVNPALPSRTDVGLSKVIAGTGFGGGGGGALEAAIVNASELEAPPPGEGLETETFAVPAEAISEEPIEAVRAAEETKDVVRAAPFQSTVAPLTKFEPFTVREKAAPPAAAELGESEASDGTGFGGGAGAAIVKTSGFEVPPPGEGLETATLAAPAEAMSEAEMAAVTVADETKVVARALPVQVTEAPGTKSEPVTVRVRAAPPAVAELGESEASDGTGFGGGAPEPELKTTSTQ